MLRLWITLWITLWIVKRKKEKRTKREKNKNILYIYLGKSTYPQARILANLSHNL